MLLRCPGSPIDNLRAGFHVLERKMKGHARHLMTDRVFAIRESLPLLDAGRALVAGHYTGAPVVDDEDRLIGFLTDSDILEALLAHDAAHATARDVMSHPPIVADEFMRADEVMNLLRAGGIHHLPVVRLGRLVGIITPHDVLEYLVERELPVPPEDA